MNKKELAAKIFYDLIDNHLIDDLIAANKKDEIIKTIEENLSSYLIIEGGNILKNDNGKARI